MEILRVRINETLFKLLKVKQVSLFKQALNQNHFSTKKHNYE